MKTLKQLFGLLAILAAVLFVGVSCSNDNANDEKTVVPFDIEFSTGEAVWDEMNPSSAQSTLVLNKLGVGTTGTVPYLEVSSSIYWTVSVKYPNQDAEGFEPWLEVSPLGGPQPALSVTNVYLEMGENKGEDRSAVVVFTTLNKTYEAHVTQRGPLTDPNESRLVFVKDHFGGSILTEDTMVKFYTFSDENGRTYSGVATAGDLYAYCYGGSDHAYASLDEPSQNYYDVKFGGEASGGANIKLAPGAYFDIKNFNNQDKTDFYMSFGAKNSNGKFRTSDLKLYISHNGVLWHQMEYVHTESPTNDWSLNTFDFSIAPNVSKILYFRFQNDSEDDYRIDDIFFSEYEPSDNVFPLIEYGSDIIGLPANFKFNNLSQNSLNGQYWMGNGIVLSEESGAYDDEEPVDFITAAAVSAHVQFICGSDASMVKRRADGAGMVVTGSSPKVTGQYEGDYWIWTIPVYNAAARTNLSCEFTFMGTDAGVKYHYFEYAQCTADEYPLSAAPIIMYTDEEKRAFYDSLDWTIWDPITIEVPNSEDLQSSSKGIPIGSASSPAGYWKGEITYSNGFKGGKSSFQQTIDPDKVKVSFPDAMDEGYYFLRLRAAANLTCGATNSTNYQRINKVDHNGTNYLRQTAQFKFAGCGDVVDYEGGFKVLALFSDLGQAQGYTGAAPEFSGKGTMGVYAGAGFNMKATTSGNNQFVSQCPTDETGKEVYIYAPYDASNAEDTKNVALSVPADQLITDGQLVADSAPFVMVNSQAFRTTRAIRSDIRMASALLNLRIYSKNVLSDKVSKVVLKGSKIAGAHYYNLETNDDVAEYAPLNEITANATKAMTIPTDEFNPISTYLGIWEGEHTLTAEIYAGAYFYTVQLPTAMFDKNKVTPLTVCLDEWPKELAPGEVITAIDSAEKFKAFLVDLGAGKEGEDMQKYRNIDGDYGFSQDIDFEGVDMATWPMATLNENFNGGGFRIKNLKINTPDRALFKHLLYGNTISNIIFDESCELNVDVANTVGDAWALLVLEGGISTTASSHSAMGNIENVTTYAKITMSGKISSNTTHYVGGLVAHASGANDDIDAPSHMSNCYNRGQIIIENVEQLAPVGSSPYHSYTCIGGLVGRAAAYEVTNCENHADIIMRNVNRKFGLFYIGGIVAYNSNRVDSNTSNLFGNINNCVNYGNVLVGQDGDVTVHGLGLGGLIGRSQWGGCEKLTNNGAFKVKATMYDPFATGEYTKSWEEQVNGATNTIDFVAIGGVQAFAQSNMAVGFDAYYLLNNGNMDIELNTPEPTALSMKTAENCGLCVGGVWGLMGANAMNPRFTSCSNAGTINVKSNYASADVYVGGMMGKAASNRFETADHYTISGCSNVGTVNFITDNPETVRAYVGGVNGATIYGVMDTNINGGSVNSQSTHPESKVAAILGIQHAATSTGRAAVPANVLELTANAVGGSVNGVAITEENFEQYLLGGNQLKEGKSILIRDNSYFSYIP